MPVNWKKYPNDWQAIRQRILQRAQQRCEWCGAVNYAPHPITTSRVILTIAHIDHNEQHNDPANLAALCQRCHLRHDRKQHASNAAKTRRQKQENSGQLVLKIS